MKLYATVTSERATKGQGGKELDIIVYNDKKQVAITIKVKTDPTGRVLAFITTDIRYSYISLNPGFLEEAEKGEKVACENHAYYREDCRYCMTLN